MMKQVRVIMTEVELCLIHPTGRERGVGGKNAQVHTTACEFFNQTALCPSGYGATFRFFDYVINFLTYRSAQARGFEPHRCHTRAVVFPASGC